MLHSHGHVAGSPASAARMIIIRKAIVSSSTQSLRSTRHVAMASSSDSGQKPSGSDGEQWWQNLRQSNIHGPSGEPAGPMPGDHQDSLAEDLVGKTSFGLLSAMERQERQRVWDAMRGSAWVRYQNGEMPSWFDPDWLLQVCVY